MHFSRTDTDGVNNYYYQPLPESWPGKDSIHVTFQDYPNMSYHMTNGLQFLTLFRSHAELILLSSINLQYNKS